MNDADQLINEHYADIYRLSYRLMGEKEAAADLTQEVFYRALRALPKFRGEANIRTWLYRITLNEAKRRPRGFVKGETTSEEMELHPAREDSIEDEVIRRSEAHQLYSMIEELPDKYREVVILHYLQGLNVMEVASIVGCPENTVKTWLSRARGKLKEKWGAQSHEGRIIRTEAR